MAALQISTLRTAFENLKKDATDVGVALFSQWCDYINKHIFRVLIGTEPERFIKTSDYSVTSATDTYSLPADFRSIDTFGTGLFYVNDDGTITNRQLPRTSAGSSTPGWYLNKGNIIITPFPTNSLTYRMRYIPNISTLTAYTNYFTDDGTLTGNIIVPDEYLEQMVMIMDKRYTWWDEDPSAEGNADQRYMNAVDEFISSIRRESNNIDMPDSSIDFSYTYTLY